MMRIPVWLKRLVVILFIGVIWELTTGGLGMAVALFDPIILAQPSKIIQDLYDYAQSGLMGRDLQATLSEAFAGLSLGIISGILVGLLFGYFRPIADLFEPIMVALNSLPRVAVAPILMLWFGLGVTSKIFLSLFTVFFVVFFNTFLGVRSVDPELVKAVRVMGGTRRHVAEMVVLPSVFAWIFAALRTSVSFALTGAVVGEFVGSTVGLGHRMLIAAGLLHTERVFGILLLLMVIGIGLVELSKRVEQRLLRWRPPAAQLG
jgi:NitT/TauT family transport system permease protein